MAGIDWNDVYIDPRGGPGVIRASLLAGVVVSKGPTTTDGEPDDEPSPTPPAPPTPPTEPPADDGEGHEEGDEGDPRYELPSDHIARAHKYLVDCWLSADGRSTTLVVIGSTFYRYGAAGCWTKMDPEGLVGDIIRWSSALKRSKQVTERGTKVTRWMPAAMTNREARDVLDSVRYELMVDLDGSRSDKGDIQPGRFWMAGTQAASQRYRGSPVPVARPWERITSEPGEEGLPPAMMLMPLRDGLLDLDAWDRGEVARLEHTTRLFNLNRYPYSLPWGELMAAAKLAIAIGDERVLDGAEQVRPGEREKCRLEAFATQLEELSRDMAPRFWNFLEGSLGRFPMDAVWADPEQAKAAGVRCGRDYDQSMRELAKFGGYLLSGDVGHHKGNVFVLHGPPGGGKGTMMRVYQRVQGKKNVVSLSIEYMGKQEYLHACMGKSLVVLPDERPADLLKAREGANNIKKISGGDSVAFRALFNDPVTDVQLYCRFLVGVNEMPNLADEAMIRRMVVVDFSRTAQNPDIGLDKALSEPREQLGQLIWMLMGRLWLRIDGRFIQPESSRATLEVYEGEADKYKEFAETCLDVWTPDQQGDPMEWRCRAPDVTRLYQAYCHAEHNHTGQKIVSRVIAGLIPTIKKLYPQSVWAIDNIHPREGGVRQPRVWVGFKMNALAMAKYTQDAKATPVNRDDGTPFS